jgi:hypothetical protein
MIFYIFSTALLTSFKFQFIYVIKFGGGEEMCLLGLPFASQIHLSFNPDDLPPN